MKKVGIILTAVVACSLLFVSWTSAKKTVSAAAVIDITLCGVIDGDGNFYLTTEGSAVVTSNGNGRLTCKATGVPNSTGTAVTYRDFGCNTPAGFTTDSHETVSASGNVTLQCFVH
jgi:hypothetical protein